MPPAGIIGIIEIVGRVLQSVDMITVAGIKVAAVIVIIIAATINMSVIVVNESEREVEIEIEIKKEKETTIPIVRVAVTKRKNTMITKEVTSKAAAEVVI